MMGVMGIVLLFLSVPEEFGATGSDGGAAQEGLRLCDGQCGLQRCDQDLYQQDEAEAQQFAIYSNFGLGEGGFYGIECVFTCIYEILILVDYYYYYCGDVLFYLWAGEQSTDGELGCLDYCTKRVFVCFLCQMPGGE